MELERSLIDHLSSLARIELTDDEAEAYRLQLSLILEQFELLKELDTTGIAPTGHAANLSTVTREDETRDCLNPEEVLSNAPRREGDFFRVNAVLED